jgi:hypothetical protein
MKQTYLSVDGGRWGLPDTPLYLIAPTKNQTLLVPCFNYAEIALVEWYLKNTNTSQETIVVKKDTFPRRRGPFVLSSGVVRDAAEYSQAVGARKYSSRASGSLKGYLIAATARKILSPLHRKTTAEIIREQIRKGV